MGKGNKVRGREIKKPKQDKAQKAAAKAARAGAATSRTFISPPPTASRATPPRPAPTPLPVVMPPSAAA